MNCENCGSDNVTETDYRHLNGGCYMTIWVCDDCGEEIAIQDDANCVPDSELRQEDHDG